MYDQVWKTFCEAIKKTCEQVQELVQQLARLFNSSPSDVQLPIWKPYRCRVCGRRYTSPKEVRFCMKQHPKWRSSASVDGKSRVKHTGLRVAPRNREATMRSTEIRRYKQTTGSSERR